jgi:hypothetical protein
MALKDWKKKEYEGTTDWIKGNLLLKMIDHEKVYGKYGFGLYLIDKDYVYSEIWRRKFQTKQQALNYAKNYMRTH